jgi:membrane-bound metal-dependent hydrolase YbcI (DUF457 family)
MRGMQHLTLTVILANLLGVYLLKPSTIIDVMLFSTGMLFVAFGSLAPDIDIKQSMIRKWYVMMPMLPFWIAQLGVYWVLGILYEFKHRGVMHSLIGWSVSFAVIGAITDIAFGRTISMVICGGFAVGYLAHLIEDELTTKTRIDWIPAPRLMKSWKFGITSVLLLLIFLAPVACAADDAKPAPTIKEIGFDDAEKSVKSTFTKLYFFTIFIITLIAGMCAAIGHKTTAIRLVQGVIASFFIVYVLPGILFGWTT